MTRARVEYTPQELDAAQKAWKAGRRPHSSENAYVDGCALAYGRDRHRGAWAVEGRCGRAHRKRVGVESRHAAIVVAVRMVPELLRGYVALLPEGISMAREFVLEHGGRVWREPRATPCAGWGALCVAPEGLPTRVLRHVLDAGFYYADGAISDERREPALFWPERDGGTVSWTAVRHAADFAAKVDIMLAQEKEDDHAA